VFSEFATVYGLDERVAMGANAPNLGQIIVERDIDADLMTLTVRGLWDNSLWSAASASLRKCFAEHPSGLIVDLTALQDDGATSVATWMTAQRVAAQMTPPVQMAMCVPPSLRVADRLQRQGARRYLPVYATVRQARVALASRMPLTDRLHMTLPSEADSPALARDLVSGACVAWQMPHLLNPCRVVMSELVTNAVEHGGSPITVTVTRRGAGLHLAVADTGPARPVLLDLTPPRRDEPLDERGRGLRTVESVSTIWGCEATAGGKIVWATVRGVTEPR
jgi:anti-sigma regulatory factor (Ser/Thr protein kinase)